MGRPTLYTPQLVERIAKALCSGKPLAEVCRGSGMPAYRTVKDWIDDKPEVSAVIARAREAGEDVLAAECLRIADTPSPGVIEKMEWVSIPNPDDEQGPAVKELQVTERRIEDMLGHRKLQIDTRLKLLAKFNPKRWGEKAAVELTGAGGGPIQSVTATLPVDPNDAALVYQEMMQGKS